jgi:hypothetical protein
MGKGDRLCLLDVGVAGDDPVTGQFRLVDEDTDEPLELHDSVSSGLNKVQAEVECDLVVTRPARMELVCKITDQFSEPAFDGTVDVLVRVEELKGP